MQPCYGGAFTSHGFSETTATATPLPNPHSVAPSQKTSTPSASLSHPGFSASTQPWLDNVARTSGCADEGIQMFQRLKLGEECCSRLPASQRARSWPPTELGLRESLLWLNEYTKPPLSSVVGPTDHCTVACHHRVAGAHGFVNHASEHSTFLKPFSLDGNLSAANLGAVGTSSRPRSALDYTQNSGKGYHFNPFGYDRSLHLSQNDKQPSSAAAASIPKLLQQHEPSSTDTGCKNKSSFGWPLLAPGLFGAKPTSRFTGVGASERTLEAASHESLHVARLQTPKVWKYESPHRATTPFVATGTPPVPGKADYTSKWKGLGCEEEGPSPKNRKIELYKTEMCRNWEQKGSCGYGRWVNLLLADTLSIAAADASSPCDVTTVDVNSHTERVNYVP